MHSRHRIRKTILGVMAAALTCITAWGISMMQAHAVISDTGTYGIPGSSSGVIVTNKQQFTIWFDDHDENGQPKQGWNMDSYYYFMDTLAKPNIGYMRSYSSEVLGGRNTVEVAKQAAQDALDTVKTAEHPNARIVGMSIGWTHDQGLNDSWGISALPPDTFADGIPEPGNALPDSVGWGNVYDASTGETWRDHIYRQGDTAIRAMTGRANLVYLWFYVVNDAQPPSEYKLSATTQAQAPSKMTAASSDAVHDTINTTVLDQNGNAADQGNISAAQQDTITADVTLHYGGYGTRAATSVTKQTTITPGQSTDSPDFTPSDFVFTNRNGQQEAWTTWGKGDYWFTISIPKQGHMKDAVSLDQKEDAESFSVKSSGDTPDKNLYDETDKRTVNERTESLVYNMTYYAQILAYPEGSSDLWIRDVIDTTDVTVDDTNAYVTGPDGSRVQADIKTTQSNGQTTTIAHVSGIVQPKGAYTLHVPQAPGARTTSWVIKDTPGWSVTGPDQFTDFESRQLPVQPPTPDKVWVLDEDGALTAQDPNRTNAISDVENGHADTKTFLLGDAIGAVVNGKIRKSLVDPLKSYSITDDVSGSSKYVKWDVSKTKVFIDGKDCTAYFDVSMSGNRITATAKDSFLKANTGVINGFGKSDHVVKLYVAGVITAVGQKGETVKLVNAATESVNGQDAQTNEPYVYVWQPNPDKAWVKVSEGDGKIDAVIDPSKTNHATDKDGNVSGDNQTFLDGAELGSVVNGQVPANLAESPSKLVLYDDWTNSNYLVDPEALSGVRVYESDVTDTSKSTVQDIVRAGKDVTKYFTIAYDSTDLTQASKCTATAKKEYLDNLRNLAKGKQITLVIPMRANYANGKGAEQVRKDYGVGDGDEVVMTNDQNGKPFTNIAGEIVGGSAVETNVPWIHGYVPPVKKDVLAAADESGDQRSIDGGKAEPGDKLEYVLTTDPKFPSDTSYAIKQVTVRDKYDDLLTVSKQTVEVHDLNGGSIIPRSKYSISWDDEGHQFTIAITDKQLLEQWKASDAPRLLESRVPAAYQPREQWKASGAPRLQVRFEATMATEDKIPDSRKDKSGYVQVDNQWFLRINVGNETGSNVVITHIPPFEPDKKDTQSAEQGDPKVSIDGKTFLLNDTGEYRITIDASEYSAPSETDKTTDAYNVYRLGIVDDYDDEYLSADAANVRVLDEKGSDVTGKFNVQVKDGILYVFAKLVDTVVPSTQETVKATQPDDLKAYAENTKHDPETEPAIDQSLLGQKYTVVMPYKVTKVTDGYVVRNVATQLVDDRKKVTNEVSNPLKPLNPKKDVTVTVGGDSIDGSEVVLNSFFNYKLESSTVPANRAYPKVTRWGITDSLDEKYDKFSGQWVVIARNDVYGNDGSVLFKAGDVIAESKAHHAATAKSKALEGIDADADAQDDAADTSDGNGTDATGDADAKDDADDEKAGTDDGISTGASANGAGTKSDDADADATASDDASKDAPDESGDGESGDADDASASDGTADELAECDRILSDDTDISEKTEAYGGTPYFTATYENGTYSISATDAFLELVSADTEHEYAWDAYVQCERTWVTERHENVFTETFNNTTSDSNVVWTYTPEHPSITLEKYDVQSGLADGDRDSADEALTVSGDTQIAFLITNTGDVPLVGVSLSDETVDGTGTVTGITFPDGWDGTLDPGESVTALGTLSGVEPGTTHTDTGTVTGKSYYTGSDVSASDDWHGKADPAPIIQTGDGSGTVAFATLVAGTVALGVFVFRRNARRAA